VVIWPREPWKENFLAVHIATSNKIKVVSVKTKGGTAIGYLLSSITAVTDKVRVPFGLPPPLILALWAF
jgi:hypothetical protein